jgi:hypothetical protein
VTVGGTVKKMSESLLFSVVKDIKTHIEILDEVGKGQRSGCIVVKLRKNSYKVRLGFLAGSPLTVRGLLLYTVRFQEAKYVERWPNTTSAWAGWSRFDIPVDRYGGVHSLLIWTRGTLGSPTWHRASQQENTYSTKYQKADRASTLVTLWSNVICVHRPMYSVCTLSCTHNKPLPLQ